MQLNIRVYTTGLKKEREFPEINMDDEHIYVTSEIDRLGINRHYYWQHKYSGRFNYAESSKALEDLLDWFAEGCKYYNETGTLPPIPSIEKQSDHST